MSTPETFIHVAISAISLFGIVWNWRMLRLVRIGRLRQDLFVLRDEAFERAASGAFAKGFDTPEYRRFEFRINALIRHAHRFGYVAVFMCLKKSRQEKKVAPKKRKNNKPHPMLEDLISQREAVLVNYLVPIPVKFLINCLAFCMHAADKLALAKASTVRQLAHAAEDLHKEDSPSKDSAQPILATMH